MSSACSTPELAWLAVVWVGGLTLDFCPCILRHFAVQSFRLERWLQPGSGPSQYLEAYTVAARNNGLGKSRLQLTFLADAMAPATCGAWLIAVGFVAFLNYRRAPKPSPKPTRQSPPCKPNTPVNQPHEPDT